MGKVYYVPRSVKGESRILYIFTIKSFLTTLVVGGLAAVVTFLIKPILNFGIFTQIIIIIPFAVIGYVIGAVTIPDIPLVGPLQKAAGENILDILLRFASFGSKKKVYMYNVDRTSTYDKIKSNGSGKMSISDQLKKIKNS